MAVLALGCKAVIAVLLLTAGGAKLADLAGFGASVRLFWPARMSAAPQRAVALGIAVGEIVIGAASLSSPQVGWLNPVVLVIGCGFVVIAAAGYRWHPGRSCRCFGALSGRGFGLAGIGRAAAIAVGAAVALAPVRLSLVQVGMAGRLGLLATGLLVALASFSAAAAVGAGRRTGTRWA